MPTEYQSFIFSLPVNTFLLTASFLLSLLCFTFTTPWANSADDKLMIFSYFYQKTGFDILCKLSHKCHSCSWGKIYISVCRLLKKKIPSMPNVNLLSLNISRRSKKMLQLFYKKQLAWNMNCEFDLNVISSSRFFLFEKRNT